MPEIVEVETFRRQLEPILIGKRIIEVKVNHLRSIRRHKSVKEFTNLLLGKDILEISRFGKYLTFHLDDGSFLNAHLRMSGRFLLNDDPSSDPKHSHIILTTEKNRILFIDPRTFGEMWVTLTPTPEISRGIDALTSSNIDLQKVIMQLASKSTKAIKAVLLDQHYISGIGNIYADEICSLAKINVSRRICDLKDREIYQLITSIKIILKKAIKLRGSSLRDESFLDLNNNIGSFQKFHRVHAKAGQQCSDCGSEIVKTKIVGRTSYFCPKCQT